jgi:cold shock CspA family protein/ribosome-associated translation inhibitor RaiA
MQIPLEIHFHNMDPSPAIEAAVRERAGKLERFAEHIVSCRVTVEVPHRHQHQGNLYTVRVDLRFPGGEVIASRDPSAHHAHEDVLVAMRDAFKAARRQLQDRVRVQRGDVKPHEIPPHGKIAALFPNDDCGRITASDGRDIYFHRNSVLNADFDHLEPGLEVRFHEERGDEGPRASSVHVIGRHHIVG